MSVQPTSRAPDTSIRLPLAILVAALAVLYVHFVASRQPHFQSDFDQIWYGARALRLGQDPYSVIGPGREWGDWPWPLYYPLPALLPALPLSYLDVITARAIFASVSAGCFTFLVSRNGYSHLAALLSASLLFAVSFVQFAPLLACAAMSPAFGWVVSCKPNMGLAVLSTARSNKWLAVSVALSVALVLGSFALQPTWPMRWLEAIRGGEHFTPYALRPGGALLLLALLRWRRPEARWLAALSVMPGTPGVQEALILFTVPQSFRSILLLAIGTHFANFWVRPLDQFSTWMDYVNTGAMALLAFVYLPSLIAILRRPNEGEAPEWLEVAMLRIGAGLARARSRLASS